MEPESMIGPQATGSPPLVKKWSFSPEKGETKRGKVQELRTLSGEGPAASGQKLRPDLISDPPPELENY